MGGGLPGARASRPHAVPLRAAQFPCDGAPCTLPGRTAWARPKQSPGGSAGRTGSRRWPRLCQELCGRDARAPGMASSRDVVAAKEVQQQPPMRTILCIHVQSRILLDGSAPSRAVSMGPRFLDIAPSITYSWPSFGGCVYLAAPIQIGVPTTLSTLGWLPAPPQPCPTASPSCSIRNVGWWF